jgi:hypothetical protein
MTEKHFKTILGFLMIAGHMLIVCLVIGVFFAGGVSFEEMTTSIGIISPLFAGYTSAIVAFIIHEKIATADNTAQLRASFMALSSIFPILFFGCIAGMILMQCYHVGFANFEQFKTALAGMNGLFGVYVGQFMHSLFQSSGSSGTNLTLATSASRRRK